MSSSGLSPEAKAAFRELRQWQKVRPTSVSPAEERARSLDWLADICERLARYGPPAIHEQARAEAEQYRRDAEAIREYEVSPPPE